MGNAGYLTEGEGGVEFHHEAMGLVVRGDHLEWVLEAAAEVIAETERLRSEVRIEELEALARFGKAAAPEVEAVRNDARQRFERTPRCVVSIGALDYKWTPPAGRGAHTERQRHPGARTGAPPDDRMRDASGPSPTLAG